MHVNSAQRRSTQHVITVLARRYQKRTKTASDRRLPFQVLIATILSARTRDETTSAAAARLFRSYPTAQRLSRAEVQRVRRLIRPVGFFRTKSRNVIHAARILEEKFHGRVPDALGELMNLPGVGRKTANVVRNYAFHRSAIAVDTHVHRIANRIGWVKTKTTFATEQSLERRIPIKHWTKINDLFVKFGKDVCRPITPQCWRCPIVRWCHYPKKVLTKP